MLIAITSHCLVIPAINDMCCLCILGAACYWLFVVANCIASGIFIIAMASMYSAQTKADRTPALTGSEVIK